MKTEPYCRHHQLPVVVVASVAAAPKGAAKIAGAAGVSPVVTLVTPGVPKVSLVFPLDVSKLALKIQKRLLKYMKQGPSKSDGPGYIYIYYLAHDPEDTYYKIGRTKRSVEKRMKEWNKIANTHAAPAACGGGYPKDAKWKTAGLYENSKGAPTDTPTAAGGGNGGRNGGSGNSVVLKKSWKVHFQKFAEKLIHTFFDAVRVYRYHVDYACYCTIWKSSGEPVDLNDAALKKLHKLEARTKQIEWFKSDWKDLKHAIKVLVETF